MATETWVMNASITTQGMFSYPFESNGSRFESIRIMPVTTPSGIVLVVYYENTTVYTSLNGWPIEAYRTITLDDPATGNFLTWLQSNAVKQSTTHGTSKILIDGVGIDLTADTVAAGKMLSGYTAHDSNGDSITGNIPSKAAQTYMPGTSDQTIIAGQYLSGAQVIRGDANLIAGNIRSGVTIFGKTGTLQPAKTEQSKTLTLGASAPATVMPDSGRALSSVPVSIDTSVIKAENIAKDVQILGIMGTHEGGGGELITKYITQNGTYTAADDDADGYSQVTVAVSGGMSEDAEFAWFISTIPVAAVYPEVSSLRSYAFYSCSALTTASFPACTNMGSYAFYYCSTLTTASFPVCTTIGGIAFYYCKTLTTASFPACTNIGSQAFAYCYSLVSLYLTGSQYVTLSASNAFTSTPIGGYTASTGGVYGSVYVPASMLESYKTRTNWSFFSSRLAGV